MFSPVANARISLISALSLFLRDKGITYWFDKETAAYQNMEVPFAPRDIFVSYLKNDTAHSKLEPKELLSQFLYRSDIRKQGISAHFVSGNNLGLRAQLHIPSGAGEVAVVDLSLSACDEMPHLLDTEISSYHFPLITLIEHYFLWIKDIDYSISKLFVMMYLCHNYAHEGIASRVTELVNELFADLMSKPSCVLEEAAKDIVSFAESSPYWAEIAIRLHLGEISTLDGFVDYLKDLTRRVMRLIFRWAEPYIHTSMDLTADFDLPNIDYLKLCRTWSCWSRQG